MIRKAYRLGKLGKSALLGAFALGIRALIQAAYLLFISRWLGAEGYGLFAGSVALAILGAPLANWGSTFLLTHHIAQNRSRSRAMWATALIQTGAIGGALSLIILSTSLFILQGQLLWQPMLLLAVSELILLPIAHVATSHCYALERSGASAVSICLIPTGRLGIMLTAIACNISGTPENAALTHFTGSLVGLLGAVMLVTRIDGLPDWKTRLSLWEATQQGSGYAISNAANNSYLEIDKVLILQFLGATIAGPYTAAFRISSMFILPISALISAVLPRLTAQHKENNQSKTYRATLIAGLSYSSISCIAMLICAPITPLLLGPGYEKTGYYLILLSPWPILFVLRQYFATKLTASNQQASRSITEIIALAVTTALNIILLPRIGEAASIFSLLATEAIASTILWRLSKRPQKTNRN